MSDNSLDGESVGAVFRALPVSVKKVDLSYNRLGDAVMEALATAVAERPEEDVPLDLNLCGNGITSVGIRHLTRVLHKFKRLDLRRNRIHDEGARLLGAALQEGEGLKEL